MYQKDHPWRVAILDLYDGAPNQGMRCLLALLEAYARDRHLELEVQVFDVRGKHEIADTSFQMYVSTGGPGNPLERAGSAWEGLYFSLIHDLEVWNGSGETEKKWVFFICHSFQLLCRHYGLATVCKRKSPSFGVFPVHLTPEGARNELFRELPDPFQVVDSRNWQVISPDFQRMKAMGAEVLALEKERPHVPLERGLMAIRFSRYFSGTQFHPEADPVGMAAYLEQPERKKQITCELGEEKYQKLLVGLHDPDKILLTQKTLLPAFWDLALEPASLGAGDDPEVRPSAAHS